MQSYKKSASFVCSPKENTEKKIREDQTNLQLKTIKSY